MKRRIIQALLTFMGCVAACAQCPIETKAFAPGETVKYNAYYNWGFF
jgi:hypothetical protein